MQAIEIAREVIARLLPGQEGATSVGLNFEEINSLQSDDPKKSAWLALCGLSEVIVVSRMLKSYPEEFHANTRFSDIHIWLYEVQNTPNSIQPALAILFGVQAHIEENTFSTAFKDSVRRGSQNIKDAIKVETNLEQIMQDPDIKPIEPLPKGIEMDLSWSGGQEYPFAAWLKALQNPWRSEQVFLQSGRSYKKVHLKERLRYDRARIIFWSTVSAQDKHLAYWWTPETIERTDLVDWIYRCWVAGSHSHPEPNLYPDQFYETPSMPSTNLKYITIWDIHNPETVKILREIFEKVNPNPENLLTQALYLDRKSTEGDPAQLWTALLGTKEIGDIHQMCVKYPKGMMGAQIFDVDIVFHAIGREGPLRVSVIVGLQTEESFIVQAGDPNNLAAISEAAIWRLSILDPKRLQIQVSHSGIGYHPFQAVLEARTSYKPSKNPSYMQIHVEELPEPNAPYAYDFDISSQENHISLKNVNDNPVNGNLGWPQLPKNQYSEQHLGEVMFSVWFAQEGWSKIKDVTFGKASDSIRNFVAILLGRNTKDLTLSIPNDGGNDFKDILNFFFENTLEGKSIRYLIKHRAEFLAYPEIQLLEFASFENGAPEAGLLVFLRFGEQLQSDKNEPIDQVMERLIFQGIANGRENELVTQHATSTSLFGYALTAYGNYEYDPTPDKVLLSLYNFRKNGEIDSPIRNLPQKILNKLKHSGGAKVTAASAGKYLSTSVENKANSLFYEIAVSQALGNVVIIHLPEETQMPEQLSEQLTDAIYATWVKFSKEDFVYTKTEEERYLTRIGIRTVTLLELSPETKRIIAEIRNYFSNEIRSNGFIEFENAMRMEEILKYDGQPKGEILTSINASRSRMWLALLGTPEVAAIDRIYHKYLYHLDKTRHIPRAVHDISISWLPTGNQGQDEEMLVLLVNLESATVDGNAQDNPDQNNILSSYLRDIYLMGDVTNFCERFCGLGNPLSDSKTLDTTTFQSEEIGAGEYYEFGMKRSKSGGIKFPWKNGLEEIISKPVKKLESCNDYSSIIVSNVGEGTHHWLKVSQHCHHLVLDSAPRSTADISDLKSYASRRQELAKIYFESWGYRLPEPNLGSAELPFDSLEYVSIEQLSDETIRILDFMGELWAPEKIDLRRSTPPIIDSRYLRQFRSSLFYGKTQGIHAWNLLLGSLEIGAVAEMIRLYPSTMRGHRIESIVIWPTSAGAIRALVRISRPDAQTPWVRHRPAP
ncbi:uncharacterized protein DFL_001523 [Arthrobotrys flagrans]|uniref:Uncharacterized protein n=1 Tax=Arthrobotrys flagrans TaxID=97331 RepID=A0A437A883_ARTFL|nr:hypothetical protein DFL_001523 [Arthrobotrys flagrans]